MSWCAVKWLYPLLVGWQGQPSHGFKHCKLSIRVLLHIPQPGSSQSHRLGQRTHRISACVEHTHTHTPQHARLVAQGDRVSIVGVPMTLQHWACRWRRMNRWRPCWRCVFAQPQTSVLFVISQAVHGWDSSSHRSNRRRCHDESAAGYVFKSFVGAKFEVSVVL